MACFSHFETAPNPLFHGVFSLQVHFSADALDQRTTVERGELGKALGAEKPLKLHEVIPDFGIVFIFDVDAVKQTLVVSSPRLSTECGMKTR